MNTNSPNDPRSPLNTAASLSSDFTKLLADTLASHGVRQGRTDAPKEAPPVGGRNNGQGPAEAHNAQPEASNNGPPPANELGALSGGLQAIFMGLLDGQLGSLDAHSPADKGGEAETLYLRGFITGAKYALDTGNARPPENAPQPNAAGGAARPPHTTGTAAPETSAATPAVPAYAAGVPAAPETARQEQPPPPPTQTQAIQQDAPRTMPDRPPVYETAGAGPSGTRAQGYIAVKPGSPLALFTQPQRTHPIPPDAPARDPNHSTAHAPQHTPTTPPAAHAEPHDDDVIPPNVIVPPASPPPFRPPRHTIPSHGHLAVFAHPELRLPDGTDRREIASNWDEGQRHYLFSLGDPIAWVRSERELNPADVAILKKVIELLNETVFIGQSPIGVIEPLADQDGRVPASICIHGKKEQIDYLVAIGTWSTSLACIQVFPNEDIVARYACTLSNPNLGLDAFYQVWHLVKKGLRDSLAIRDFIVSFGKDPETIFRSLELDCVLIRVNGRDTYVWNVLLTPPSANRDDNKIWRTLVAATRPGSSPLDRLEPNIRAFRCGTCGCWRHPTGLCPTISTKDWMGFLPMPHPHPTNRVDNKGKKRASPQNNIRPSHKKGLAERVNSAIRDAHAKRAKETRVNNRARS